MHSPFMTYFHTEFFNRGFLCVKFNFEYMEARRRVPDPQPKLQARYRSVVADVIEQHRPKHVIIGGKSMGGRVASYIAGDTPGVSGLVFLGYPLHPPGKPTERRDGHLGDVRRPMLIVQGSRDTFGMPAEFGSLLGKLSPPPMMHVVEGGDHSFKITRGGKGAQDAVYEDVQRTIVEWIEEIRRAGREKPQPRD